MSTPLSPQSVSALPAARSPTWALAGLALTLMLSSLGTGIANVGLPTFVETFDAPLASVRWVVLAYLLMVTLLVVGVGRWGDRFGRRRLLLAGIALFTLASLACASVDRLDSLIAARAVQGVGGALMMTLSLALVGESVACDRVGRAMGWLGSASAIGTALGPPLGGVLIDRFGWPALFLVNLPLGLIAMALVGHGVPRDRVAASVPVGDSRGFRRTLLRSRTLRGGLASNLLTTAVAMTTLLIGPFYLSGALQLGATDTGLVMSAGPVMAAIAAMPAGRGVDRWGAPHMITAGLFAMATGAVALAVISTAAGTMGYVLPLMLLTAGFATFQAANNTAVLGATDASRRGVVSGWLTLSRHLGFVAGASAMPAIYATQSGVVHGTRAAFAVAAGLILLALAITRGARYGADHTS